MSGRARRSPFGAIVACGLLLVAVSVGSGSRSAGSPPAARVLGERLISGPCGGPSFCISPPSPGPVLYPGASPSPLPLTLSNPLTVQILLSSVTVTFTNTFPTDCDLSALQVGGPGASVTSPTTTSRQLTISPYFPVPAAAGSNPGSAVYNATLALADNHHNQNPCQHVNLAMSYSAQAYFTVGTTTRLAAASNPASVAQTVTVTATVSPTVSPAVPNDTPVGSVTFYKCTNPPTCNAYTTLGPVAVDGTGTASTTTSFGALGSYKLYAVFTPTDLTNFTGSTSATILENVSTASTSSSLTSSLNPSLYGQTVTFTDTAISSAGTPAGNVTFYDGATVIGTGTLNASGKATLATSTLTVGTHGISASYAGNGTYLPSNSNVVSQVVNYDSCVSGSQSGGYTVPSGQAVCGTSTGKINGGVTVPSGSFFYLSGGTVDGGVTVNGGGSFYMTGGTVNGNITVQSSGATFVMNGGTINGYVSSAGAKTLQICGASNIGSTVTVSGTTSYVIIGDGAAGSACTANKIGGAVTLTNNTAGVEVSLNNITGNLTLTNNAGGTISGETANEVEANKVTGNVACTSNTAAPINDGKPNAVSGSRTGQCIGF